MILWSSGRVRDKSDVWDNREEGLNMRLERKKLQGREKAEDDWENLGGQNKNMLCIPEHTSSQNIQTGHNCVVNNYHY